MLQVKCVDKYTDENRPYEFGFTIDGEQHRHEKKDENGIIMGEFGFITADGVYHVTVYATDENGNFKILSMKNIRVKPYPTAKSGSGPERGRSLEYSLSPIVPTKSSTNKNQEQNKKQHKEFPKPGPASPAKSCSHCKLPTTTTTTTEAPYIPSNNIPPVPAISQELEIPPKNNQYKEEYSQKEVRTQEYLQQEEQLRQGQQERKQQQLQQGQQQQQGQQHQSLQSQGQQQGQGTQQNEPEQARLQQQGQQQVSLLQQRKQERHQDQLNNAQKYPTHAIGLLQRNSQMNTPNYPQQSYNQEELQSEYQKQQQQQQQDSNQFAGKQSISPFTTSIGSQQNYPEQSQSANDNYPQPSYTQSGLENSPNYETGTSQSQTNVRGKGESNYPGSDILQTQSVASDYQGPMPLMPPETNRNPKSYDDQSNKGINALSSPASALVPRQNSPPKKPQLISAQMQIVDKNTDIHYKRPGEKEGLPEGLTKDDMSQLLYTFNYTVGFHGHFEEGYKNGAKVGYYYVTGRNGVRTRVDYVADEKGFRPKITQEILDLLSDDVPKPDTEKDSKYGLKGYEFKWLYYPVDTK
ncbi:hypothetical protein RR48_14995 [Papilio machaon]|uniref:Protein lethal(3)malignant blood neoplasm 1 n=1 Tax=Papilio machaon TaxID=76193 RepID=A0A194R665_PAPMA|nr:hypothetical protein RR48_14995 [Papilio machaon]